MINDLIDKTFNDLFDELTIDQYFKIYNRNGFEYILKRKLNHKNSPSKLYLLDFKNIKGMNESIGYKKVNNKFKKSFSKISNIDGILIGRAFSGDEIFIHDQNSNVDINYIKRVCLSNELEFKYITETINYSDNVNDKLNFMIDKFHITNE